MLIQNCHLREDKTLLYLRELYLSWLLRELGMGLDKFDGSIHGVPLLVPLFGLSVLEYLHQALLVVK